MSEHNKYPFGDSRTLYSQNGIDKLYFDEAYKYTNFYGKGDERDE